MFHELLNLLRGDSLMVQALDECHQMANLCREMIEASVVSLRQRDDASIDVDVGALDKQLNRFERDVRRKVMTHLLVKHDGDISSGLVLVSIVVDLERMGDHCKNIHELARNHPTRLNAGPLEERLKVLEEHALDHAHRSLKAFCEADVDEATSLMTSYKEEVSAACREMEAQLVRGEVELSATDAVAVALYLRFLKRIGAHGRNLVSALVNPFPRIGYRKKDGKDGKDGK